jgi:RHS repeat-associated protein
VTFNNALVANFNYDNAGRKVAANFGNGIVETRTYQADNLNTSINTPGVTSFGYTWDANKRKLTQTETGIPLNNQTYSYDDEDRLASFNRNNGDNQTWNLSLVGDWNQFNNNGNVENRTHNAVHEITTVDANPLAHDLKGNLTQNKNGQTYAWDIENRLTTATVPAGCPEGVTGTHTYTYDALGRRVSKTVGGNTTVFVSDGMQEIAEYVNGAFSQSYVYGSYIDEPLAKYTSGTNPPLYYHASNLYSIAALTDNAGNVVERYRYDPYGKATILAPDSMTVRPNSLCGNDRTHQGLRYDRETGLIFNRARMFDPNLGQFIARDPIGYIGDICSLYLYTQNAPIFRLDPSGYDDIREHPPGSGIVGWMPEGFMGWNQTENFVPLGTLKNGVVHFNATLRLKDMDFTKLQEYGSYDSYGEVWNALIKDGYGEDNEKCVVYLMFGHASWIKTRVERMSKANKCMRVAAFGCAWSGKSITHDLIDVFGEDRVFGPRNLPGVISAPTGTGAMSGINNIPRPEAIADVNWEGMNPMQRLSATYQDYMSLAKAQAAELCKSCCCKKVLIRVRFDNVWWGGQKDRIFNAIGTAGGKINELSINFTIDCPEK